MGYAAARGAKHRIERDSGGAITTTCGRTLLRPDWLDFHVGRGGPVFAGRARPGRDEHICQTCARLDPLWLRDMELA